MVPGIEPGDKVWVDPYSLSFSDPERGQVLAFYVVADKSDMESLWIKRVVGLGGDTVEVKAGRLLLNGQPVPLQSSDTECSYAQQVSGDGDQVTACDTWLETLGDRTYPVAIAIDSARGEAPPDFPPIRVPEGTVFMLGDNRDYSKDSRSFGPIPLRRLLGPVRLVLWSAGPEGTRFGRILSPVR
jgi:signal peptidase I